MPLTTTRHVLLGVILGLVHIDHVAVAFTASFLHVDIVVSSRSPLRSMMPSRIITTTRSSTVSLFSSRRRSNDDYYYYEDDEYEEEEDNDGYEVRDRLQYPSPRPRGDSSSKMKPVPRKRQSVRIQEEDQDDDDDNDIYMAEEEEEEEEEEGMEQKEFLDDEPEFVETAKGPRNPARRQSRRRDDYDEVDENDWDDRNYYEEDDDDDIDFDDNVEAASGGNFWSNPTGGLDRPPPSLFKRDLTQPRRVDVPRRRRRLQREYDGRPDYYVNDSKRTPRRGPAWRSPVRVGAPPPNPFLENLYDRLFFYGIDMDDDNSANRGGVGNKSVFGGTKGKFNGLKYLAISEGKDPSIYDKGRRPGPPRRESRGLPPARSGGIEEDYYEDDDEYEEDYSPGGSYPSQSVRDRYNRRMERGGRSSARGGRPRYEERDDYGFASGRTGRDWVSEQVSMWFTDEDGDNYAGDADEFDRYEDEPSRRIRRRRGSQISSPLGMIDSFLRRNQDQMAYKAAEYDSKMGIRRPRSRKRREREERPADEEVSRENPRRPGYAYRYDASLDDDDSPTVLDIDATVDMEEEQETEQEDDVSNSAKSERKERKESRSKKSEKSWEERQAAVERVPPADVPAWGPKGQLPINARQKAIENALKDIQTAKKKVNERVKREIRARDEVAILNVDAKALRLKMDQSRRSRSSQIDIEELRRIELEIEDASRALRRARKRVDLAREELEELEDRHYAVLSYYNPDQASKLVGDALDEFSGQVGSSSSASTEANGSASPNS